MMETMRIVVRIICNQVWPLCSKGTANRSIVGQMNVEFEGEELDDSSVIDDAVEGNGANNCADR